jgi:hypothetical protein
MFERFTERARRVIFFARYEASSYGSMSIETEHFLLGLLREDKNVMNRFLGSASSAESIRTQIEKHITVRPKASTSIGLPLTDECKRILKHAAEEAEALGHRIVGTEHLLLGILRESDCLAARLLIETGVQLERIREELRKTTPSSERSPEIDLPPADHPSIHALVDQLPEQVLSRVKWMLYRFMAQPSIPWPMSSAFGDPAQMAVLRRDEEGKMKDGRVSSTRHEEGAIVVETHQLLRGHQVSTTERFRMSDDGKMLSYSHAVVGPKPEQQHKHAIEFDLP